MFLSFNKQQYIKQAFNLKYKKQPFKKLKKSYIFGICNFKMLQWIKEILDAINFDNFNIFVEEFVLRKGVK